MYITLVACLTLIHVTMKNIIGRSFLLTLTKCHVVLGVAIQKVNTAIQSSLSKPSVLTPDSIQGVCECAEFLHVSRRSVSRMVKESLLPYSVFGGRKIFLRSDLNTAIERIPLLKSRKNYKMPDPKLTYRLIISDNSIALFRITFCYKTFFIFTPVNDCLTEEATEALIKSCTLLFHKSFPFKTIPYEKS